MLTSHSIEYSAQNINMLIADVLIFNSYMSCSYSSKLCIDWKQKLEHDKCTRNMVSTL